MDKENIGLTQEKKEMAEQLMAYFNKLTNDWDRKIAVTYLEGMAATSTQKPQAMA